MKVAILLVLLLLSTAPALASVGVIEETETSIVVEYNGNPGDHPPASQEPVVESAQVPVVAEQPETPVPDEVVPAEQQ